MGEGVLEDVPALLRKKTLRNRARLLVLFLLLLVVLGPRQGVLLQELVKTRPRSRLLRRDVAPQQVRREEDLLRLG